MHLDIPLPFNLLYCMLIFSLCLSVSFSSAPSLPLAHSEKDFSLALFNFFSAALKRYLYLPSKNSLFLFIPLIRSPLVLISRDFQLKDFAMGHFMHNHSQTRDLFRAIDVDRDDFWSESEIRIFSFALSLWIFRDSHSIDVQQLSLFLLSFPFPTCS